MSFKAAMDHIVNGDIDVAPLCSHIYDIERIDQAMATAFDPVDAAAAMVALMEGLMLQAMVDPTFDVHRCWPSAWPAGVAP